MSVQLLFSQLLLGTINGAFYALLSLGLAIIFGLLNLINFAHGAQFMLGAFVAWMMLNYFGLGFWWALLVAPLVVGALAVVFERTLIRRLYNVDPLYGLMLTFGAALVVQGLLRKFYGVSGMPYDTPELLSGSIRVAGVFVPKYRVAVVFASLTVCVATWLAIEKTRLGAYLRAATENPSLVESFGINVPRLVTLTYGFGVGLAGLAGVLAAPIYSVSPAMGEPLIIVIFAVVVIGGLGSIHGALITGLALGLIEGFTKVVYPAASTTVIFGVMALVLIFRPAGLFGRQT
jgi:branched-chain amino acid transport system permease protein